MFTSPPLTGQRSVTRGRLGSGVMRSSSTVADCPECRAVGTVIIGADGVCCACFAEFRQSECPQLWRDEPLLSRAARPSARTPGPAMAEFLRQVDIA